MFVLGVRLLWVVCCRFCTFAGFLCVILCGVCCFVVLLVCDSGGCLFLRVSWFRFCCVLVYCLTDLGV